MSRMHYLKLVFLTLASFLCVGASAQVDSQNGTTIGLRPFGSVQLPNGYYSESREDLMVKVMGGEVVLRRAYLNTDVNRQGGTWVFNTAWAVLRFVFDSLDGSTSSIWD